MKRLLAGLAGVFGIRWILRKRRAAVEQDLAAERAATEAAEASEPAADARADELRERIEQAKATADDRDEYEAGETLVDADDPSARRAAVHEGARSRIDEMSTRPESDSD
jgi:hypothetical protein